MVADAGDPLVEQHVDDGNGEWAEDGSLDTICPPGEHNWVHESCLICNVCKECTGYGRKCVFRGKPDRHPWM